jgi:type IV pilus assembly protein PilV
MTKGHVLKQNQGFSILESLIGLAIFSVAFLGTSKFQIESTKNQSKTHFQTLALYQLYDMSDRIKANAVGFSNGSYNNPNAIYHESCLKTRCSSSEMAEYDFYEWNQKNAKTLPSGNGSITTSGDEATIKISWNAFEEAKELSVSVRVT